MNNYINIFLEFLYLLCNAFLLFRICEENMHNKISIPMKLFYIIVFVVSPATIHAIGILSYFAPILFMGSVKNYPFYCSKILLKP